MTRVFALYKGSSWVLEPRGGIGLPATSGGEHFESALVWRVPLTSCIADLTIWEFPKIRI